MTFWLPDDPGEAEAVLFMEEQAHLKRTYKGEELERRMAEAMREFVRKVSAITEEAIALQAQQREP